MLRVIRLLASSIALAASAAAVGFFLSQVWLGLLFIILWFAFWVISLVRQYSAEGAGVGSSALFAYVIITLFAIGSGVWPGWLLLGLVAALAAWDLEFFILRTRDVEDESLVGVMINQHVRRLFVVSAIGLVLPGTALFIHYDLTFGMALGIGLLAAFGVTLFVNLLHRPKS